MSGKDEKHPEDVADPGEGVQHVKLSRRVLSDEEIQQRQPNSVTGEPGKRKHDCLAVEKDTLQYTKILFFLNTFVATEAS